MSKSDVIVFPNGQDDILKVLIDGSVVLSIERRALLF